MSRSILDEDLIYDMPGRQRRVAEAMYTEIEPVECSHITYIPGMSELSFKELDEAMEVVREMRKRIGKPLPE